MQACFFSSSVRSILITLIVLISACDPNDKIVRASPEKPVPADKSGGIAKDSSTGTSGEGEQPGAFGGGRTNFGGDDSDLEKDGANDSDVGGSDIGSPVLDSSSQDSIVPPTSDNNEGSQKQCSSTNAGSCFQAARSLIQSDPSQAIELYLKACVPSDTSAGDGLACRAAAVLTEASGDKAGAAAYFEAACQKVNDPVINACFRR